MTDQRQARILVPATTAQLAVIREHVRRCALDAGLSEFDANNVALAVDEACANLIQHAYKNDGSKDIGVSVTAEPTGIRVEITDTSAPFDPSTAELPDMRRYFLERRHHGLGILLMTRVMDGIEYRPSNSDADRNVLILFKRQ
jgi:anti-sigma regulatory factor (Ser/Thr protein kinase)